MWSFRLLNDADLKGLWDMNAWINYKQHLAYGKYVLYHKWCVIKSRQFGALSLTEAFLHDLSKFTPSEWFAYARTFYSADGQKHFKSSAEFKKAWLLHQRRNPHHWEYWLLRNKDGSIDPIPIPLRYLREMVVDWIAAGLAITGRFEFFTWYLIHKSDMILHERTRATLEQMLKILYVECKAKGIAIVTSDETDAYYLDI
jgi:hypothetical protein